MDKKNFVANRNFTSTTISTADGMAASCRLSVVAVVFALCSLFSSASSAGNFFSDSATVFLSINCGSSESYTDENLIDWTSDKGYIHGGESRTVNLNGASGSPSRALDTLRVFPAGRKKYCYDIDSIRQGRVLVRATFYYGNYDGQSSPPSFDLLLDGNRWTTVRTSNDSSVQYEVTYVMKTDLISVCVAQTAAGEFPFISAVEVRALESYMYQYSDVKYPLYLRWRLTYAANATVRFPDDPYDRIWTPSPAGIGQTELHGGKFAKSIAGQGDSPPPAALQSAISAVSSNSSLNLFFFNLPDTPFPVYFNGYFSEVSQLLLPNQMRSFRVSIGDQLIPDVLRPVYGNFSELYAVYYNVSSKTPISVVPANDSTLPPIINAAELFEVGSVLTNGTDGRDVEGLFSLRNAFEVLQEWGGDPCLPVPYSWEWIACSIDSSPRVTALFLRSFNLTGLLPAFLSMDALETIDVSNNTLTGPVPEFLSQLPNLKQLNLSKNHFNGSIPASLSQKNGLNLVVTGNPYLCSSGQSCTSDQPSSDHKKKNRTLAIVLGITIPLFVIVSIVIGVIFFVCYKRKADTAVAAQNAGEPGKGYEDSRAVSPLMKGHKMNMEDERNLELVDRTNGGGYQGRDRY